ncbi:MAG: flavin reductase family protein [Bacteroidota bacterium]
MPINIQRADIDQMERFFRTNLINSLSGFKSVNLIGTTDSNGTHNLAIFSSFVHIGANPPLMGFIQRPLSVPRDTYNNILQTGYFTVNHLNKEICHQSHQTAARYPVETSEFEATGLQPFFSEKIPAPYVTESHLRFGLRFREAIPIPLNGTLLVIGEIEEVFLPDGCLSTDGFLDLEAAGSLTVSGLDAYYETSRLSRLSYAKADAPLSEIPVTPLAK